MHLKFERRTANKLRNLPSTRPQAINSPFEVADGAHFKPYSLILRYSVRSEMPSSSAAYLRRLRCLASALRINSLRVLQREHLLHFLRFLHIIVGRGCGRLQ